MSTYHDIGIYVRSFGSIVGARRVDRTIDFYDLLDVLSEITGFDLNVYSLNVSSVIYNGSMSSTCPIKNTNDLGYFFHPNAGNDSVELIVEAENLDQFHASEDQHYQSGGSGLGGRNEDQWDPWLDEVPQVTNNAWDAWPDEVPQVTNNAWDAWPDEYNRPSGSTHGILNEASHMTNNAWRAWGDEPVTIVDIPGDSGIANNPSGSEGNDSGCNDESSDEGSDDNADYTSTSTVAPSHSMPRVAPHPNYMSVPFFSAAYDDVPVDSVGISSGDLTYDADEGVLHKGMIFKDKKHLQSVVKDYSIRYARREYRVVESSPTIWKLVCKQNYIRGIDNPPTSQQCMWWLRAKFNKRYNHWEISKLGEPHSCLMDTETTSHRNLCKNLLAADMESFIQTDPGYKVKYVITHAKVRYDYEVSYQKAWQALKRAIENVYGTWESSCQFLPKFMGALQKYNPGTIVEWRHKNTIGGNMHTLGYVFWAFRPCIEAFTHCRKILTVDGTHLYTKYKHKLLIANTLDADQKIISVAYAIVDEESYDSWRWFLSRLATYVIRDMDGVCLISDRHKGILKAVERIPAFYEPRVVHRYCLRHVASKFNAQFKNVKMKDLCYAAGQALSIRNFEKKMAEIQAMDERAYAYLREIDPSKWTFCHDGGYRFGVMTTNISEAINGVLKGARRLPITAIVNATFTRSKNVFLKREQEAQNLQDKGQQWPDHVLQKYDREQRLGMQHQVDLFNYSRRTARVTTRDLGSMRSRSYRVSLSDRSCDCGRWKLDGIPCSHALEVCRQFRVDSKVYVPDCYSTEAYAMTYTSEYFEPLPDIEMWDEPSFQLLHNPERRIRRRGRNVTSRIHNEMDWAQIRARQQYQAQDRAGPSH